MELPGNLWGTPITVEETSFDRKMGGGPLKTSEINQLGRNLPWCCAIFWKRSQSKVLEVAKNHAGLWGVASFLCFFVVCCSTFKMYILCVYIIYRMYSCLCVHIYRYIYICMHLVTYTSNISSTSVKTIQLKLSATNSAKASQENRNTVKLKASFDI